MGKLNAYWYYLAIHRHLHVLSLKTLWQQHFTEAWRRALGNVKSEYKSVSFPEEWPHATDWETILTTNFWESL